MYNQKIFIAIIIALGIAVASIGSLLLWLKYQPSAFVTKDYSVDKEQFVIDQENDLFAYVDSCSEEVGDHYPKTNFLAKNVLAKLNKDFAAAEDRGYVIRQSCRDSNRMFLFMDSYNRYWNASEAGASESELGEIARTVMISYAPFGETDLQEIRLEEYGFGGSGSVACYFMNSNIGDMFNTEIEFQCLETNEQGSSKITYRYNYQTHETTVWEKERTFVATENNKTQFTDPDLFYSFEYPSDWGAVTTRIISGDPAVSDTEEIGKHYQLTFENPGDLPITILSYTPDYQIYGPPLLDWTDGLNADDYCQLIADEALYHTGCSLSGEYPSLEYAEWHGRDGIDEAYPLTIKRDSFIQLGAENDFPGLIVSMQLLHERDEEFAGKGHEQMADIAENYFESLREAPHYTIAAYTDLLKSLKIVEL